MEMCPQDLNEYRLLVDEGDGVFEVGDDAKELEALGSGLVVVGDTGGNEDGITGDNLVSVVADSYGSGSGKDVLLMLDRVGVIGHAAVGFHDEAAEGEVGRVVGSDEYFASGAGSCGNHIHRSGAGFANERLLVRHGDSLGCGTVLFGNGLVIS